MSGDGHDHWPEHRADDDANWLEREAGLTTGAPLAEPGTLLFPRIDAAKAREIFLACGLDENGDFPKGDAT